MPNPAKQNILSGASSLGSACTGLGAINQLSGVGLTSAPDDRGNLSPSDQTTFNNIYGLVYPTTGVALTFGGMALSYKDIPSMLQDLQGKFTVAANTLPDDLPEQGS